VPALEYAQTLQERIERVSDLEIQNQKLKQTLGKTKHCSSKSSINSIYLDQLADVKSQGKQNFFFENQKN